MPVIGLTFTSMEAKRNKVAVQGEVSVNTVPKINDVKEVNVSTLGKKALNISFELVSKYNPGLAEIKVGGDLIYLSKSNAPVVKEWKKNKKLPETISAEVLNHLFRRCLLKIANMADDLQLPPPLKIPRFAPKA